MTLEAMAYVAGIVAAVAAIGSLYYAWRQYNRQDHTQPHSSPAARIPEAKPLTDAEAAPVAAQPPEHFPLKVPVPTDVPENLLISFEAAKGMWNKPNRDQTLVAVAKRAMDLDCIDFAIAVAVEMWNKPTKDDLLTEIVIRALDRGQLQKARVATDHFFNLPKKDRAMRMIVERAGT